MFVDRYLKKTKSDFNQKVWIFRIVTLSIALASVLYYLHRYHQNKPMFLNQFGETKPTIEQGEGKTIKMKIPVYRSKD